MLEATMRAVVEGECSWPARTHEPDAPHNNRDILFDDDKRDEQRESMSRSPFFDKSLYSVVKFLHSQECNLL